MAGNILASDLLKRRKEQIFVGGYDIDTVQTFAGSVAAGEDVFSFFGTDAVLADVTVNNGRLSLSLFDRKSGNTLLDVLTKKDPDTSFDRRYKWEDVSSVSVWANRREQDNKTYNRGSLYRDWLPVPGMTAGDVTARGTRTFEGNCDNPVEFNQPIRSVKVRLRSGSGTTPNFQAEFSPAFLQVPGETSGVYALQILAVNEQRIGTGELPSKFDVEDLTILPGMFSGSGTGLNLRHADLSILSWMTHAFIVGLYDAALGVIPDNVTQDGLLKNVA